MIATKLSISRFDLRQVKGGWRETVEVKVPVQTLEQSFPTISVPHGVQRVSVPLEEVRAWKIDGTPLSTA